MQALRLDTERIRRQVAAGPGRPHNHDDVERVLGGNALEDHGFNDPMPGPYRSDPKSPSGAWVEPPP